MNSPYSSLNEASQASPGQRPGFGREEGRALKGRHKSAGWVAWIVSPFQGSEWVVASDWSVDAKSIDPATFDLAVKNPNGGDEVTHRNPKKIIEEIVALDAESAEVLEKIKALI